RVLSPFVHHGPWRFSGLCTLSTMDNVEAQHADIKIKAKLADIIKKIDDLPSSQLVHAKPALEAVLDLGRNPSTSLADTAKCLEELLSRIEAHSKTKLKAKDVSVNEVLDLFGLRWPRSTSTPVWTLA